MSILALVMAFAALFAGTHRANALTIVTINEHPMVSYYDFARAIGADIRYVSNKEVSIARGTYWLKLTPGRVTAWIDARETVLDASIVVMESTIFVPVAAVCAAFALDEAWFTTSLPSPADDAACVDAPPIVTNTVVVQSQPNVYMHVVRPPIPCRRVTVVRSYAYRPPVRGYRHHNRCDNYAGTHPFGGRHPGQHGINPFAGRNQHDTNRHAGPGGRRDTPGGHARGKGHR